MREICKGLSPHSSELMIVSWQQYSQKDFRDELIQYQDMLDESRRRSRFRDFDGVDSKDKDRKGDWTSDPRSGGDFQSRDSPRSYTIATLFLYSFIVCTL